MALRYGGRQAHEFRELEIKFERLARADGSARFGFTKSTSALASISGPIEAKLSSEHPSQATLEVLVRPLSNVPATESKSLAAILRSLLLPSLIITQNPRTLIQVVIQSLSASKAWKAGTYAAMINAATIALLNAGSIPMRGVITAVSVGRLVNGKGKEKSSVVELVVDPSPGEEPYLQGGGCFAFMSATGLGSDGMDCVWANWTIEGKRGGGEEEIVKAKDLAKIAAKELWRRIKKRFDPAYVEGTGEERDVGVEVVVEEEEEEDDNKMEI